MHSQVIRKPTERVNPPPPANPELVHFDSTPSQAECGFPSRAAYRAAAAWLSLGDAPKTRVSAACGRAACWLTKMGRRNPLCSPCYPHAAPTLAPSQPHTGNAAEKCLNINAAAAANRVRNSADRAGPSRTEQDLARFDPAPPSPYTLFQPIPAGESLRFPCLGGVVCSWSPVCCGFHFWARRWLCAQPPPCEPAMGSPGGAARRNNPPK